MPDPINKEVQDYSALPLESVSFNDKVREVIGKVDAACTSGEDVRLTSHEATLLLRHIENSQVAVRVTQRVVKGILSPPQHSASKEQEGTKVVGDDKGTQGSV